MPQLPYHVYMDLDVVNNDFASPTPPRIRFAETRGASFLGGDNADYVCSFIRRSPQTTSSPSAFIPR